MISSNINITKPTYMEKEFSLFKKEKEQSSGNKELSESEKKRVQELKKIDREVRTHEQAHLAASGGLARGGASFTYTKGSDGRKTLQEARLALRFHLSKVSLKKQYAECSR